MYSIFKITSHPTVDFAAEELKKYLRMMMPRCGEVSISYLPGAADGFRLGLMCDFGLDVSDAEDTKLDDIVYIRTDADGGIIAGSNPGALLIAVYRYLRFCGCRWLFPGVDGEWIPVIASLPDVSYRKKADYRYRGQCNEGAEFQPNMIESIDFAPKIGMNTYMLEFDIPSQYYNKYYEHAENAVREPEPITFETILQWKRQCEVEIQKRGLHFHDMGHGWTAEPFGIESNGSWEKSDRTVVPKEVVPYLAEINGKRELYRGVPLCTNICYSNPKAREIMAKYIADYAEKQNNVDFLHVWLADDTGNQCECAECRKKIVSDWYIILLNEIDAELTRRNLDTHLVFIDYTDTIWPPKEERLLNPKRFTMLYAGGTCLDSYLTEDADFSELTEFVPNRCVYPKNNRTRLGYLYEWKKVWPGDCFCYQYHFFFQQYYDPGSMRFSRLVYDDVVGLKRHGLNGIVEDCSQRSFFPTGFAFYVYGETLFDSSVSFDALKEDYFSHAFGENWREVAAYLETISDHLDFAAISEYQSLTPQERKQLAERAALVKKPIEDFAAVIAANKNQPRRASSVAWRLLDAQRAFAAGIADILEKKGTGDDDGALRAELRFKEDFSAREIYMERCYDQYLCWQAYKHRGVAIFSSDQFHSIVAPT